VGRTIFLGVFLGGRKGEWKDLGLVKEGGGVLILSFLNKANNNEQ